MKRNTKIKIFSVIFGFLHAVTNYFVFIYFISISSNGFENSFSANQSWNNFLDIFYKILSFPLVLMMNLTKSSAFDNIIVYYIIFISNSILWGIAFYILIKAFFGDKEELENKIVE